MSIIYKKFNKAKSDITNIYILCFSNKKNKKIGIVSVRHNVNVGNNLVKYAISIKLKELGYIPYIIGTRKKKHNSNITFINFYILHLA